MKATVEFYILLVCFRSRCQVFNASALALFGISIAQPEVGWVTDQTSCCYGCLIVVTRGTVTLSDENIDRGVVSVRVNSITYWKYPEAHF